MKLLELFDHKASVVWVKPNIAHWEINGVKYQCEIDVEGDDDYDDEEPGMVSYVVSFTGQDASTGAQTHLNTNAGNQFAVYATVFDCVRQFIDSHGIAVLQFSAGDAGRQRLYKRFIAKYLPNWEVDESGLPDSFTVYPPGSASS